MSAAETVKMAGGIASVIGVGMGAYRSIRTDLADVEGRLRRDFREDLRGVETRLQESIRLAAERAPRESASAPSSQR